MVRRGEVTQLMNVTTVTWLIVKLSILLHAKPRGMQQFRLHPYRDLFKGWQGHRIYSIAHVSSGVSTSGSTAKHLIVTNFRVIMIHQPYGSA